MSGGNRLEHIDTDQVKSVYAIDINNAYLDEARRRFGDKIKQLNLVNGDIGSSNISYIKADFIWAALIFEYIDIERCFQFVLNNAGQACKLIATIQSNNGMQTVSETGVESIKSVASILKS